MGKDIDQKIAEKEAELARLRQKKRSLDAGQKIVVGAMVIEWAREDKDFRTRLLQEAGKRVKRPADKERIDHLLTELFDMDAAYSREDIKFLLESIEANKAETSLQEAKG
jgi:hypothetical protein